MTTRAGVQRWAQVIGLTVWLWPFFLPAAESVGQGGGLTKAISLPRTGQLLAYDQNGKLINFQGSGQDGEFQRGMVWPEPRFVINPDATISDSLTGLMWLKDGNCFGDLPWPTAVQMVADFNQGTASCHEIKTQYHDWLLPDINQLASLLDFQAGVPSDALKMVGLAGVQKGVYWSATAYRGRLNAWGVDFANGSIVFHDKMKRHPVLIARIERAEKNVVAKIGAAAAGSAGEAAKEHPASRQRFIDNGDGTVTDGLTGLMWLQDGSCLPRLDWQGAIAVMRQLNGGAGGAAVCSSLTKQYTDWSVPNVVELRSLIDYEADYSALSSDHPFKALEEGYWTATTAASVPEQAFMADFDTGAMLPAPKAAVLRLLAVREVVPPPERSRKESEKGGGLGVDERYLLVLDPEMPNEIHWPPEPRFFDNGDGTIMDAITGINWLVDANCFGKKSWKEAAQVLTKFNSSSTKFKCVGYEGGVDDWELPTLAEFRELINKGEKDNATWLTEEGIKNLQGGGSYWTATETPLNLYFADAISLKTGKEGNYPKSLEFFVWPKRTAQNGETDNEPLLHMTANSIDTLLTVSPNDPLSLAVNLHTFGLRMSADFWFWYDTPDKKKLWLTPIRTWTDKATPVYQGPLFNLRNYEIFRSAANGLAPGVYDFHFAADTVQDGVLNEPRFEIKMSVAVPDGK